MASRRDYRLCQRCKKNRQLQFFAPKGRICVTCRTKNRSKASHESRVMATYGLLKGEYQKLYEAQEGRCYICGRKPKYRLAVDHCHKTDLVRGLLCKLCNNRILPASRDNPEVLRKAADYLENPPALQILGERYYRGK